MKTYFIEINKNLINNFYFQIKNNKSYLILFEMNKNLIIKLELFTYT